MAAIPLFPLGTVLMPGVPLPLHIFEPRYRQLTVDLVTGAVPGKEFGIIAVREGFDVDRHGVAALAPVGCSARLLDVRRLPDGRYDVVTEGARRFRLRELDEGARSYLCGTVEWLPDSVEADEDAVETRMLVAAARAAHAAYCTAAWKTDDWREPKAVPAAQLAHLLAADCLLPLTDRQDLLEERAPLERLRAVRRLLARERGLLRHLRAVPTPMATYAQDSAPN